MNNLLATTNIPRISVIMSVFNGIPFISEAIESVLTQTFTDFEFIIVDDHSTDDSVEVIEKYSMKDARIQLIKNDQNLGITKSLNIAISVARGEFVARMDADDISLPERFLRQVEYLETHPEIGIISSGFTTIDNQGRLGFKYSLPHSDLEIRWQMLFQNAFCHPSVIIRRKILETETYNPEIRYSQDYDLWSRVLMFTNGVNLHESLLLYRIGDERISRVHFKEQQKIASEVSFANIVRINSGLTFSLEEATKLRKIYNGNYSDLSLTHPNLVYKWMDLFSAFARKHCSYKNLPELITLRRSVYYQCLLIFSGCFSQSKYKYSYLFRLFLFSPLSMTKKCIKKILKDPLLWKRK